MLRKWNIACHARRLNFFNRLTKLKLQLLAYGWAIVRILVGLKYFFFFFFVSIFHTVFVYLNEHLVWWQGSCWDVSLWFLLFTVASKGHWISRAEGRCLNAVILLLTVHFLVFFSLILGYWLQVVWTTISTLLLLFCLLQSSLYWL